jgi:DNA-binding SARP family transcriptional activator/pimeloyl-ACP methyl ester carboxylesterase
MRIRVLGPLGVLRPDGHWVTVAGRRQQALLAVLVARANSVVSSDALIEALWSDDPPDNPSAALHNQVARLRRTLGGTSDDSCRLTTRPGGYVLEVGPGTVDADRFARLLSEASAAIEHNAGASAGTDGAGTDGAGTDGAGTDGAGTDGAFDAAAVAEAVTDALALWQGRPFGDLADLPVVEAETARLEELHASGVELRSRALRVTGRPQLAIVELEPFVVHHPLREQARAELMRCLYATGRHADALGHYDRYRRHLADELGLEPSVALQRLQLDILRHELPDDPTPAASTPAAPVALDDLAIRYATRHDGARIAYATVGDGTPLVAVPAWVCSLDLIAAGRDPRSSVLERLAHHVQLVLYDRLGTGLSRAPVPDHSASAAADELVALLEHLDRPAALFAMSQAGPTALLAAARRPELVTHLTLFGTFADGPATFTNRELVDATLDLGRAHWPLAARLLAGLYRPDASPSVSKHLARVLQESADAKTTLDYLGATYETDVTSVLPAVRQPALVLHYRGDRVIPFRGGQQLATGLSQATFVPLEGDYHLPDAADLDRIVELITEGVG